MNRPIAHEGLENFMYLHVELDCANFLLTIKAHYFTMLLVQRFVEHQLSLCLKKILIYTYLHVYILFDVIYRQHISVSVYLVFFN